MVWLLLGACFFVGIHLFIAGTTVRDRIVAKLGEPPYLGLFSLLSLVGIVWLCSAYARTDYVRLWSTPTSLSPVALVLVAIGFLFAVVGITTPSPTSFGGEKLLDSAEPAKGILRVTRHPFLWGIAIWAATHLVMNGDLASLILFASLLVLTLAGTRSIDAKRRRALGERWTPFADTTSNLPFAAIATGKNRLVLSEFGVWRIAAALVIFTIFFVAHATLFDVSPIP